MNESPARPTLHVIAHIRWEREGYESFETRRARLMTTLTRLLNRMNADQQPLNYFLLGGQTVILEDIAAIRPDLLSRLVIYNAGGRLGVGPWYVLMDEMLVSGESLVRNLLLGQADARQHGLTLKPVAYVPDITGHTAQLPQILCGFGIEAAVLVHGAPIGPLPFRWDAPDGSAILVANFDRRASEHSETDEGVQDVLAEQEVIDPDGPFLWMDEAPLHENTSVSALAEELGMALTPSTLVDYVTDLRGGFPDSLRPVLRGELRVQGMREHACLFPGTMSSRLYLKQANARLESRLTHLAEPLLALALANGAVEVADNLRALLTHSWRLLLKNQSRSTLGGCGSDPVHEETEIRYRQVEDTSAQVIAGSLNVLPGEPHVPGSHPHEQVTHIVVWNPHSLPAQEVIELRLDLPPGQYPAQVVGRTEKRVCSAGQRPVCSAFWRRCRR